MEYLGLTVIMPPPTSKKTVSLGVKHAPEAACLPFKINIGNLIEASELGADTFIMAGGVGPCRFGLYAQLEKEILEEAGYKFEALVLEPPDTSVWQFLKKVKRIIGPVSWWVVFQGVCLAYKKACLVDKLEKTLQEIRCREYFKGTADKIFNYSLLTIDQAKNTLELEEAFGLAKQKMLHVPCDQNKKVLKIGLVGEIFMLLEPFASYDIEKKLGYLGAQVERSVYLSEWIKGHLFKGMFKMKDGHKPYQESAPPYLNHFVGGHGQESIGAGVVFADKGFDGIIQVAPLTCMPEIVAHTVFTRVSEACGIPVLTIYIDEQAAQEGINTRLEAFIDLLNERKSSVYGIMDKKNGTSLDRQKSIC